MTNRNFLVQSVVRQNISIIEYTYLKIPPLFKHYKTNEPLANKK